MRIKELVKTFAMVAIATMALSSSPKAEAATTTVEQAAQTIYKAETKAYNQKKDVQVIVKLPAKTKKQAKVVIAKLKEALIKEELGDVDLTYVQPDKYIRPSVGVIEDSVGWDVKARKSTINFTHHNFYYPVSRGADQKLTLKGSTLTLKMNIKGSKKYYRDQYKENTYLAKCVADLREKIDGLSEIDAAWGVAQWVQKHMVYSGDYAYKNHCKPSDLWRGADKQGWGWGVCEHLAIGYQQFACLMGIETAFVDDTVGDHAVNAVKIDGTNYYLDIQDVDGLNGDWKAFLRDGESWAAHSQIATFKTWTEDMTIGEWCLLTKKEFAETYDDDISTVDDFKLLWNLGAWWKG